MHGHLVQAVTDDREFLKENAGNFSFADDGTVSRKVQDVIGRADSILHGIDTGTYEIDTSTPRPVQRFIEVLLAHLHSRTGQSRQRYSEVLNTAHAHLGESLVTPFGNTPDIQTILKQSPQSDACSDAEMHFGDVVKQVAGEETYWQEHKRISVYLDADERLLGIRKSEDISTMLALRAFSLSDAYIPAGTIVGIAGGELVRTLEQKSVQMSDEVGSMPFTIAAVQFPSRRIGLRPLRHSAYAYAQDTDRGLFAIETASSDGSVEYYRDRLKVVTETTLRDFALTAKKLLDLCDVAPVM